MLWGVSIKNWNYFLKHEGLVRNLCSRDDCITDGNTIFKTVYNHYELAAAIPSSDLIYTKPETVTPIKMKTKW